MRASRWAALALGAIALAGACTGPGPGPTPTTTPGPTTPGAGGRAPVIFVHGFGQSASQWNTATGTFRSNGYPSARLSAISYNSRVGIATSAGTLAAEVDAVRARTGAARVDIVSHSMGSLVAKQCIIAGGCRGKVAHWESIAGVDNGTANEILIARGTASNEDVQGRTPLRQNLVDNWGVIVSDGVKVQVHWTPNDGIVVPASLSQEPPPAVNRQIDGLNHMNIFNNATVLRETIAFFAT
jgi:triacylglycerol lipase